MFMYYLKIAIRNILTNRKFSIINIAGFAFALSICMAILLFLLKEHSYDSFHEYSNQIVRIVNTEYNSSLIDYRVKDILLKNYPEIENGCLVINADHDLDIKNGEKIFSLDNILSVDNDFFRVFTIPFVSGNPEAPFSNINSAVITESTSKLIFGDESPLGKDISIFGVTTTVTITGVIRDFPDNSSISAGILVNGDNEEFKFNKWVGDSRDLTTYQWPFQIYLTIKEGSDQEQLAKNINSQAELLKPYLKQISLLRLKDIYLHDTTSGSSTKQGNAGLLNLLTGIAVAILILAMINYINLTIAQQNKRNKDTGIRKAIGADRNTILFQYLSESVMVILLAFFSGLFLLWLLMPFFIRQFSILQRISGLFFISLTLYLFCWLFWFWERHRAVFRQ